MNLPLGLLAAGIGGLTDMQGNPVASVGGVPVPVMQGTLPQAPMAGMGGMSGQDQVSYLQQLLSPQNRGANDAERMASPYQRWVANQAAVLQGQQPMTYNPQQEMQSQITDELSRLMRAQELQRFSNPFMGPMGYSASNDGA